MQTHELGITAEDIQKHRGRLNVSIFEAKDILIQRALIERCEKAQSFDDLKIILKYLIERTF